MMPFSETGKGPNSVKDHQEENAPKELSTDMRPNHSAEVPLFI
jgi:hypothetical protein